MRHLKLTIAYDGTAYHGWQMQRESHGPTVQGVLERALAELTGHHVHATAASRTDAGVHAWGQVVNFRTESSIPVEKFSLALNTHLPPDLVARQAEEVGKEFHACFGARRKTYRYIIYNAGVPSPFWRRYAWFIHGNLNVGLMREAARHLAGTHNFLSFCAAGGAAKTHRRTIQGIRVGARGELVYISVCADGFLYHMVRIIAGTLVEVGKGKREAGSLPEVIAARERSAAGETAPPQGLCLLNVEY